MKVEIELITPMHIGNGEISLIKDSGNVIDILGIDEDVLKRIPEFLKEGKSFEEIYEISLKPIGELKKYEGFKPHTTELHEHIKTCVHGKKIPYIPGSSLKGLIKTAVLWDILRNDENMLVELIEKLKRIKRKNELLQLTDRILENYKKKHENKENLLKDIAISDFLPEDFKNFQMFAGKILIYSLQKNGFILRNNVLAEIVTGKFTGEISHPESKEKEIMNVLEEYTKWCIQYEMELEKYDITNELKSYWSTLKNINNSSVSGKIGKYTGLIFKTIFKLIEETDREIAIKLANKINTRIKYVKDFKNPKRIYPPFPKTIKILYPFNPLGFFRINILKFS